jgi:hypothetical protein
MAGGGFAGPAQFSGSGLGGDAAGSLHDIAHAAADRCGNPSGGVSLGAGTVGGERTVEGKDGGDRCHDAGGERSHAFDCAAG